MLYNISLTNNMILGSEKSLRQTAESTHCFEVGQLSILRICELVQIDLVSIGVGYENAARLF